MAKWFSLFEGTSVKTIQDLIAYNEANAALELPPGTLLVFRPLYI